MKFSFRLDKMLRFIELEEITKKTEISALLKKLTDIKLQLIDRQKTIQEVLLSSQDRLIEGNHWVPYQIDKVAADSKKINDLTAELSEIETRVVEKKAELGRVIMRRRALSKLKEKRYSEFRVQQSRIEQKHLDELFRLVKQK